jgi:hypothetical protein
VKLTAGCQGGRFSPVYGEVKRLPILLLVFLASVAVSGVARAAVLPPGNSAANQYAESLPGAGGNESGHRGGAGGHGGAGTTAAEEDAAVGAETAARLRRLGPDGAAALRLATQSAPQEHRGNRQSLTPGASGSSPGPSGSSAIGGVLGGLIGTSTSGGIGLLQPLLMLLALVAAAAYGLSRRRGRSPDGVGTPPA